MNNIITTNIEFSFRDNTKETQAIKHHHEQWNDVTHQDANNFNSNKTVRECFEQWCGAVNQKELLI